MKLTIYAKNMTVSPHVTRRIEKKTERMGRYLLPDTEMQVRLSKEPKRDIRTVEITVPMGNGVILRSEASEPENLFLAIDQALAKMERQIHRHRSKLDKRIRDDAFASNELEFIEDTTGVITKRIKPNFKTLGPRYGKQMKQISALVAAFSQGDIAQIEREDLSLIHI